MRLTAKERILLHLLGYATFRDAVEVPPEMTQDGLAEAAGIELRHLTQYVRPLLREELVQERTAHVKGGRQRRKVYVLTEKGQMAAYGLRERVKAAPIRVRDAGGTREVTVARALEVLGPETSILKLLRKVEADGVADLERIAAASAEAHVEMLVEAPRLERFVGRTTELSAITAEGEGPRVIVVRGVAGIGKSSVAAKACELLRGKRNLFWHTVRPWDTRASILTALGEFLSALGKPGLRAFVARGEASQATQVLRADIPGTRAFLVFDDAHEATREVLDLFRYLKDVAADAPDATVLVLTRRAVPFYDRRDVAVRGLVREIDLAGLTQDDIAAFLAPEVDVGAAHMARRSGGHPLLLQLVRSTSPSAGHEAVLRNMNRFLEEEVYGDLSDAERLALKAASLYRVPVPRDALHVDPSVSHDVVLSLVNRSLLRSMGSDMLEVHDAIRGFFAGLLTPSEREALCPFVGRQLQTLATDARERGNPVACMGYLSNALELPMADEERGTILEVLGDVDDKIGDFPSALTAWKEALGIARAPDVQARLHRKTAMALAARGDVPATRKEIDAAWRALGSAISVERGWVDLVACSAAADTEDWTRAREAGEQAIDVFERFHEREGLARTLYQRGYLEIDSPEGDPKAAQADFSRGLEIAQELEDPVLTARFHTALAHVYGGEMGDEARALEHIAAAETTPGAMEDPQARRSFLMLCGWFHMDIRADMPTATRYFTEAADLSRKIHFASSVVFTQYGLALAAYYGGDLAGAREQFRRFATDILALGYPAHALEALCQVAECDLRLGDVEDFRAVGRECGKPELADGRKARPVHVKLMEAGQAAIRGDERRAEGMFQEALRLSAQGTSGEEALFLHLVHLFYGVCLSVWGRREQAAEELRLAREQLEKRHMRSRLSILPEAERELEETLARATRTG